MVPIQELLPFDIHFGASSDEISHRYIGKLYYNHEDEIIVSVVHSE